MDSKQAVEQFKNAVNRTRREWTVRIPYGCGGRVKFFLECLDANCTPSKTTWEYGYEEFTIKGTSSCYKEPFKLPTEWRSNRFAYQFDIPFAGKKGRAYGKGVKRVEEMVAWMFDSLLAQVKAEVLNVIDIQECEWNEILKIEQEERQLCGLRQIVDALGTPNA